MASALVDFIKGFADYNNDSVIEIIGMETVIIENVLSVIEYEQNILRVTLDEHIFVVEGENLRITDFIEKNIIVNGKIGGVRIE